MNKTLGIAIGVAMVVMPFIASAATFTQNLTVGSTGADVTALQTTLVSAGYLNVAPTGYFGNLTKAALAKWQAANGISPAVGYFGPITRAAFGNGTVSAGPLCPNGNTLASNCMTSGTVATGPLCPNGNPIANNCNPTTGGTVTGGVWAPDGTDGSITLSYVSYAPASQTLKKGDMNKPLISVKLQAINGKTAVTRFDVHFSERPWLDFGSLSLTDASGNILATKTLSSSADVTEITVGSDYLVRFDSINPIIVTPGTDTILAVTANVLAASDKITNQTVYVAIPTGAVRTINGKGYTDSVGLGSTSQGGSPVINYGNAVTLSTTGSTGTIYTRISPSTPAQRIVVTSNTQQTTGVVLGVFSVKSANQNSTLNSMGFNFKFATATASYATTSLVSNVRLSVGGQTYGANSLAAGNTTFTNMNIPLTADTWTDVTLTADINSGYQANNISASTTLVAASIVGVDSNYNTVTLTSANNITSNDTTFLQAGLTLTSSSVVDQSNGGSALTGPTSGTVSGTIGTSVRYILTLTNTGNSDVYVSRLPGAFVGTTSVIAGAVAANTASSSITNMTVADTQPGDSTSANAYVVASGASRTFTLSGAIRSGAGGGVTSLSISKIYFDTVAASVIATSSATSNNISFGLNNLIAQGTY